MTAPTPVLLTQRIASRRGRGPLDKQLKASLTETTGQARSPIESVRSRACNIALR